MEAGEQELGGKEQQSLWVLPHAGGQCHLTGRAGEGAQISGIYPAGSPCIPGRAEDGWRWKAGSLSSTALGCRGGWC